MVEWLLGNLTDCQANAAKDQAETDANPDPDDPLMGAKFKCDTFSEPPPFLFDHN